MVANVRPLLDLDPDFKYKRYRRVADGSESEASINDDDDTASEIYLSFQAFGQNVMTSMKVEETENR